MKNIKKYIPLIIVLVIAGLGFAFRENIARAVRGDAYVDNKIFTKQLEKAQKSGKDAFPQLSDKVGKDEAEVILHTSKGDITVKLFPTLAPKASENFLKHAKDKYYDGLTFHRVIKDFMIQSGDPKGDGTGGESIWKKGFAVEPTPLGDSGRIIKSLKYLAERKKGFAIGRKVSLLSRHHSSTTSVAHLLWPILVLRIQTAANSTLFKTRMIKASN